MSATGPSRNKRRDVTADISRPSLSASLEDRLIERCRGTLLMEYRIKPPGGINPFVTKLPRAKSRLRCSLPASSPLLRFDIQGVVSRRVSFTNDQWAEERNCIFCDFVKFSRECTDVEFEYKTRLTEVISRVEQHFSV